MNQRQRTRTLSQLQRGQLRILVATDVAARGIDVQGISHAVNFDLPMQAEDYVHRIGRTGRAGRNGLAFTLATHSERHKVRRIEHYIGQSITPEVIAGLEPKRTRVRRPAARRAAANLSASVRAASAAATRATVTAVRVKAARSAVRVVNSSRAKAVTRAPVKAAPVVTKATARSATARPVRSAIVPALVIVPSAKAATRAIVPSATVPA